MSEALTCDEILRGKLRLWQPRDGYRFSIDPLLLVDFLQPPLGRVIDFCAGVGVIGLGALLRDPTATATLVELQPELAALAERNARDNGLTARAQVRQLDLRRLSDGGAQFDVALANPPYRTLDEGPASPERQIAIAQHELELTLPELVAQMRRVLVPGGRALLVFPAARATALLAALDGEALRPRRLRCVHPRADEPANRVLVAAHKGARGPLVIEPPLILRHSDGNYTDEARRVLGEA
jgi:tRNA1Val (adenine37-N6)-methyltransferase